MTEGTTTRPNSRYLTELAPPSIRINTLSRSIEFVAVAWVCVVHVSTICHASLLRSTLDNRVTRQRTGDGRDVPGGDP
jgi:hypothetical protein